MWVGRKRKRQPTPLCHKFLTTNFDLPVVWPYHQLWYVVVYVCVYLSISKRKTPILFLWYIFESIFLHFLNNYVSICVNRFKRSWKLDDKKKKTLNQIVEWFDCLHTLHKYLNRFIKICRLFHSTYLRWKCLQYEQRSLLWYEQIVVYWTINRCLLT